MTARFGLEEVRAALHRIRPFVHKTPVFSSSSLDSLAGRTLHFKAECLQKTGSFKARGATNAVQILKKERPEVGGVVTHSSGNHGQAVAYAATAAELPCTVVVPKGSSSAKIDAIKSYGAQIVFCEPNPTSRVETCARVAREESYDIIHPFDDYRVMAGQATIGYEFLEQVPQLDAILVPISGGGMISGIAVAAKAIRPECRVFAVEPTGKDLAPSLKSRQRLWPDPPRYLTTVADALRHQQPGHLTFPIMCDTIDPTVFTITDEQMIDGIKIAMQRLKLVLEPASGAAVAAALSDQMKELDPCLRHIGVILCGGNIDVNRLPW
nr:serine racemase [Chrysogorgia stellata]